MFITLIAVQVYALGLCFVIVLASMYVYSQKRLIPQLKELADISTSGARNFEVRYNALIRNIRITNRVVLLGLCFFMSGGIVYAFLSWDDWRNYSPDNSISLPAAANEFIPLGIIVSGLGVIWYVEVSTRPDTATSRPTGTVIATSNTQKPIDTQIQSSSSVVQASENIEMSL